MISSQLSEPRRVLFAIGTLGGGGTERQVVTILQHLDRARFAPVLYLVTREGEFLPEVPADVPVIAFWDRHRPPRPNWPGRIHAMQVRDLAETITRERIDVVYDRTFQMTLVAAGACRRARVPRVSAAVADPERDLRNQARRFRRIKRWKLQRAYRDADRVAAVSAGVRDALIRDFGVAPARVTITPNLIDLDRIDRLAAEPPPALDPARFHIITVGRLSAEKGHMLLLEAIDELVHRRGRSQVLVHLLGRGPLESELREFAASRGLSSCVQFAGFVHNPYAYMAHAQLFCLPSLYEGSPNALIEAMACGTPVVASDCPSGPREILQGGALGKLVEPGNATALAAAIEEVVTEPARQRAVAAEARAAVRERYSVSRNLEVLQDLLIGAAAAKSARANRRTGSLQT